MRAVVAVLVFVTAAHAALWGGLREKQQAPDFRGILPSVSYSPFQGTGHPDVDNLPNPDRIRADVKILAPLTRAIRLYSSTSGLELVPPLPMKSASRSPSAPGSTRTATPTNPRSLPPSTPPS